MKFLNFFLCSLGVTIPLGEWTFGILGSQGNPYVFMSPDLERHSGHSMCLP